MKTFESGKENIFFTIQTFGKQTIYNNTGSKNTVQNSDIEFFQENMKNTTVLLYNKNQSTGLRERMQNTPLTEYKKYFQYLCSMRACYFMQV